MTIVVFQLSTISLLQKMSWDKLESDGLFSLASILDKIKKDGSIYDLQTKRIKLQDYNHQIYETFKTSLA